MFPNPKAIAHQCPFANKREATLNTQVFVLVPYSVGPTEILSYADELLERHRKHQDKPRHSRWDYLCGAAGCFKDSVAKGRLPAKVRRTLHHRVCEAERLPTEFVPRALVTPDGTWHDLGDYGFAPVDGDSPSNREARSRWAARYVELIRDHPHCWVLEYDAHS